MAYKIAPMTPLKGSFMVMGMVGFLISVLYVYPRSNSYGFAFAIVFIAMFISSLISMTHSETGGELQIDEKRFDVKKAKTGVKKKLVKRSAVKRERK